MHFLPKNNFTNSTPNFVKFLISFSSFTIELLIKLIISSALSTTTLYWPYRLFSLLKASFIEVKKSFVVLVFNFFKAFLALCSCKTIFISFNCSESKAISLMIFSRKPNKALSYFMQR